MYNKRVPDPEPHEMELQISCRVYSLVKEVACVGKTASPPGRDFHQLVSHNEPKIIEGHLMVDYVQMWLCIPSRYALSNVVGYRKGKSAIQIARMFGGRKKNLTGDHFWPWGYFVAKVALN